MTLSELLTLIGRSWSRIVIYPAGATIIASLWLAHVSLNRRFSWPLVWLHPVPAPLSLAAAWLAIALLPLPGAIDLGRGIDVVVVMALLDLPLFATLTIELYTPEHQKRGGARLATMVNSYPPLVLAILLLGLSGSSLEVATLSRLPAQAGVTQILHWCGAAALLLVVPAVMGIGSWSLPAPPKTQLALWVRAMGYALLATLPWIAPFDGQLWQLLPPLLIVALLWAAHHWSRKFTPRTFAPWLLGLSLLLMIGLAVGAFALVWQRLA